MTPRLEEGLTRLKQARRVVYDCETSGLDWKRNHVVGHVLTFGPRREDSYYYPVRHLGGGNVGDGNTPRTSDSFSGVGSSYDDEIVRALDRPELEVVMHNAAFDLKFLYRLGLRFNAKYQDTMLNQVLLNEWQPSVSLEACCKVFKIQGKELGLYDHIREMIPEARTATDKQVMGYYWRLAGDDPIAVEYAEQDGCSTWNLLHKQLVELEIQNLGLVHSIECKVIPVLARMMTRGVRIDENRLHEVKSIIQTKKKEAREALPTEFNSRAPSQVRKLMENNGKTDWPMTAPTKAFPNGQPSFSEQWLVKSDIGKHIVNLRKYENLENSFINPMIETHLFKGRVYPEYHQLRGDEYGTVTGRLSSSNPNLQQINKRNKELGQLHRSIFVPDEGMEWGSADYRQMEPTLLAYYSRCQALLDGYRADPPIDAHQVVANMTGMDRETGKRINQTLITGGGKGVLVSKYGVDPTKVDEYWRIYFEKMPEIKTLQRQASNKMAQRGFVISLLGRKCRLNDPKKNYVGLNRLLQTGNADCLKLKLVEVDDYLRSEGDDKCNILTNVHDAIDFQFHPDYKGIYNEALKIMTNFGPGDLIKLDVPVGVDHKEGKSWAEATYGARHVNA